jgi:hypothetical protein
MNLNDKLRKIYEEFAGSAPQKLLDTFERASKKLAEEVLKVL